MLAPLSWLKEYLPAGREGVDITLDPKKLGDKLTEVGLGCETIKFYGTENVVFDLEITPNCPDC